MCGVPTSVSVVAERSVVRQATGDQMSDDNNEGVNSDFIEGDEYYVLENIQR